MDAPSGPGLAPGTGAEATVSVSGESEPAAASVLRRLWPWGRKAPAAKDDEPEDPYRDQAWILAFVSAYWFAHLLTRIALALTAFFLEVTGVALQVATTVIIMLPIHFTLLHLVLVCRDGAAPGAVGAAAQCYGPDKPVKKAVRWWLGYYRWAGLMLATGLAGYFTASAAMPFVPIRYQVLIAALGVAEPSLHLAVHIVALGVVLWLTARCLRETKG